MGRPAIGPNYKFVLWNEFTNEPVPDAEFFFPSCSHIVKKVLAAEALVWWAYRTTVESVEILDEFFRGQVGDGTGTIDGTKLGRILEEHDLDGLLQNYRLRPIDLRDEAGERGTREHSFFESLSRHALDDQTDMWMAEQAMAPESGATPIERDIAKWWLDIEPKVVAAEHKVWSLEHKFAGTIDLVRETNKTRVQIVDLKTRKPDNEYGAYDGDFAQGGGYTTAYRERYRRQTDPPGILVVRGDGNPRFEQPEFDAEAVFLGLREIYGHLYERGK